MIPDYQSLMLPLLKLVSDKQEHKYRDLIEDLATEFNMTEEERKELLASGNQTIFDNRVGWAKIYLKKAGLLDSPKRAAFKITELRIQTLKKNPDRIDVNYLKHFPAFLEFLHPSRSDNENGTFTPEPTDQTPDENLDKIYQQIRKSLASDLLNKVISLSPTFFERLVLDLLVKMGYGGGKINDAITNIKRSHDDGIVGTIKEDKLGLDIIYVQAKRWQDSVGSPEVMKFCGGLTAHHANKGVMITTSHFSKDAVEFVNKIPQKLVLIGGKQLASLMIDHNVGVAPAKTYT